jgi:hypothetical protein
MVDEAPGVDADLLLGRAARPWRRGRRDEAASPRALIMDGAWARTSLSYFEYTRLKQRSE